MRRFRVSAILGIAFLAIALVACGGDDDEDDPTDCCGVPGGEPTSVVRVVGTTSFGSILATSDGLTLYTFTQDTPGKSACSGACAATWPPLISADSTVPRVSSATGEFSLVARDDGSKQLAFNGRPLYRYAPDKAPGEYAGDGVGGVWFVAKASGAPAATPGTPSGSPSAAAGNDPYGY